MIDGWPRIETRKSKLEIRALTNDFRVSVVPGWRLHTQVCRIVCVEETVPTNLAIDDRLIAEAQKLGHHRTKKETVNAALDEYVQRRKQQQILSLFGTIEYDGAYDYKRERGKRA